MDVEAMNMTFDGDVSKFFTLSEADVGLYRFKITGTGLVNFKIQELGCISAKFRIDAFDE